MFKQELKRNWPDMALTIILFGPLLLLFSMSESRATITKLSTLEPETIHLGVGERILNADDQSWGRNEKIISKIDQHLDHCLLHQPKVHSVNNGYQLVSTNKHREVTIQVGVADHPLDNHAWITTINRPKTLAFGQPRTRHWICSNKDRIDKLILSLF